MKAVHTYFEHGPRLCISFVAIWGISCLILFIGYWPCLRIIHHTTSMSRCLGNGHKHVLKPRIGVAMWLCSLVLLLSCLGLGRRDRGRQVFPNLRGLGWKGNMFGMIDQLYEIWWHYFDGRIYECCLNYFTVRLCPYKNNTRLPDPRNCNSSTQGVHLLISKLVVRKVLGFWSAEGIRKACVILSGSP